jgi:hypothetical protein
VISAPPRPPGDYWLGLLVGFVLGALVVLLFAR